MAASLSARFTPARLRLIFALFFCVLAVPTVVLVRQAFSQLELDGFRQYQLTAEALAASFDAGLRQAVLAENARSVADYGFTAAAPGADAAAQRSPLAIFPVIETVPGLLGYFQVDAHGEFTSPLLPGQGDAEQGIDADELRARTQLQERIRAVLAQNRIVQGRMDRRRQPAGAQAAPALQEEAVADLRGEALVTLGAGQPAESAGNAAVEGQAVFDELESQTQPQARAEAKAGLREDAADVDDAAPVSERERQAPASDRRIDIFDSEIEPLAFGLLDTGHFVIFRNAWRDGQRLIQGALIEQAPFLASLIDGPFSDSGLAAATELTVSYAGRDLVSAGPPGAAAAAVLHRARLSPPLADLQLTLKASSLPRGPAYPVLVWLSMVLAGVLPAGFVLLYRFSAKQMELVRQQQDFVSAVSHELKTPLTSIRMYGEMLKAGWADDAKKQSYYDFIFNESERLSRLIENVLQLARMTRRDTRLELVECTVGELLDLVRSKVTSQLEHAGFELHLNCEHGLSAVRVRVDADSFVQIAINLVDNAVKFAGDAERKLVEIGMRRQREGRVAFTVRDFGPGVPRARMRRIFELFYRPDNSLTRGTAGTGIGLALVKQLAEAMHAQADVRNAEPGAEFLVSFPVAPQSRGANSI